MTDDELWLVQTVRHPVDKCSHHRHISTYTHTSASLFAVPTTTDYLLAYLIIRLNFLTIPFFCNFTCYRLGYFMLQYHHMLPVDDAGTLITVNSCLLRRLESAVVG